MTTLLAILIPSLIAAATTLGMKLGKFLATTGADFVEMRLKAAKHDELVPVVEALKHAVVEGSVEALHEKAVENGSIDHPHIQEVLAKS